MDVSNGDTFNPQCDRTLLRKGSEYFIHNPILGALHLSWQNVHIMKKLETRKNRQWATVISLLLTSLIEFSGGNCSSVLSH